jgi:hypothetical protein
MDLETVHIHMLTFGTGFAVAFMESIGVLTIEGEGQ